ncbi:exonuclease domain-containing protein [Streptomyces rubradiris]|uniref:3'-5' exonuclease n=1 Tax=Streptomyces rubradiris TaxID=285531 RepID=A0ABQ3R3C6_STRRR|nr:exonuclease domain-containing protein [Streptomyces rubradiris]GHH29977.1 3'-5' exonuclease [Streptomyces rubradiris]GHI50360.1 3'-5' exonuclease [Streptomyces rubradiris]
MEQNHTAAPPWYLGRLCGFDLETTGVSPVRDRIVTACVVQCGGAQPVASATWMADPGVEIPEQAAAVHGITTELARAEGRPAGEVVEQVVTALTAVVMSGIPIIVMNAAYDLTMLDREARRHGVQPLADTVGPDLRVVDPFVLDKHVDPYRSGKRTLTDLCRHYQVPLDGAHDAAADALAACRVAWRIANVHSKIGNATLAQLHEMQVEWAREQAESLAKYFRNTPGKEDRAKTVRGDWPLIPAQRTEGQ